ncbi:MAG TPA: DNA primase, partial [Planctomycetaceae bacterium]|nr:DNA primase [Planctomycetaceae bacterium]
YCLTGSVCEHVLPILYGSGANGKSTFIDTILALLGPDYAMKAPHDLLMVRKHDSHPTGLADLFGRRFVAAVETEGGRRLNESLTKELTGGDPVRARRMRENYWQFDATHKLWLATNHKPVIRGDDLGIWRRIRLIPFTVTIPKEEQDRELPAKLRRELSGILNWALAGCHEWLQTGLDDPDEVTAFTDDYRSEMDIVGQFLAECTEDDPTAHTPVRDIHAGFIEWGGKMDARTLSSKIASRGYERQRITGGPNKGRIGIVGIALSANVTTGEDSEDASV